MSSEKFCLSWNDFKTNASQSFDLLRKENLFYDVTLVSEEQVNVKAHKAALSMCSNFFKNILKSNDHSHPWLFLGGISSKNIEYVMNYIYDLQGQQCSGMITCNSCGKSSRDLGNMQRHAETYIEGISYTCNYAGCGKTFRSRNALNIHKTRFSHKN